jgi:hypothetical protein
MPADADTHAPTENRLLAMLPREECHIRILDRGRLETVVCECYKVVKDEYDRLLGGESLGPQPPP